MLADTLARATVALAVVTSVAAIATALAAIYTRRAAVATETLAKHSADEVQAAQRQATASREQVEALTRPWLTVGPDAQFTPKILPHVPDEPQAVGPAIDLRVVNVGQGLALTVPDQCYLRENAAQTSTPGSFSRGLVSPAAIPANTAASIFFRPAASQFQHPAVQELFAVQPRHDVTVLIDILYTDAAGGQATWARLHLQQSATREAHVSQIDYIRDAGGAPELPPFAISKLAFD